MKWGRINDVRISSDYLPIISSYLPIELPGVIRVGKVTTRFDFFYNNILWMDGISKFCRCIILPKICARK